MGSGTSTSTGPCTAGLGGPVIANITVTLTYDVDLSLATQGVVGQSVGLIEFSATNPIVTDVTADVQGEDAELCKELTRSQVEDDPGILTPRGSATLRSGDSTVNVQGGSGGTITVSRID